MRAFKNSLIVASATTVLATFLGTIGAWMLYRYRFPFQRAIGLLIFIPMVMPEVLMGVSLLAEFVHLLRLPLGYVTLIIAHTTFCFPFVLVGVQARLQGLGSLPRRGRPGLGSHACPGISARHHPLPHAVDHFGRIDVLYPLAGRIHRLCLHFTGAQSQTLPLKVYGMAKVGLNPQLNALSTIFVIATILLVLFSELLTRRKTP